MLRYMSLLKGLRLKACQRVEDTCPVATTIDALNGSDAQVALRHILCRGYQDVMSN